MVVFPVSRASTSPLFGRSLDALLNQRFSRQDQRQRDDQPQVPPMDVIESDTAYTVVLNAPGIAREELKVSVQNRRVEVEANAAAPAALAQGQRVVYSERAATRYARTIVLPAEVDSASSQAKLENGVLTLTLNKRVPTGATQLTIS